MDFSYKLLERGDTDICEKILRSLPDWFGIESSTQNHIKMSKEMPMVVVLDDQKQAVGCLSIKKHSLFSAEIYVIGVLPNYHRQGQ